jgi:spermidine/putrescine transport system ATP-binding protein
VIEIQQLIKRYAGTMAVDRVDLQCHAGEFFSILGPSGSGKSTLLRLLAGFERADSGSIRFEGREIGDLSAYRRPFNMVFQQYALFPHLNVRDNVAFGLKMKGVGRRETEERVAESLNLAQLQGFDRRSIATLSGGQQQRVAIARAIINRPAVLLLDEPLAALDLKLRQKMQVELKSLQRRLKITFIYVTHAQDEALALSDRIAVMNKGRIEQQGTPQEIYHDPKTLFVADFIGSSNTLPVEVVAIEPASDLVWVRGSALEKGAPLFCVRKRQGESWLKGERAVVMIRPEFLHLEGHKGITAQGGTQNTIHAKVLDVLFKGDHAALEVLPTFGGESVTVTVGELAWRQLDGKTRADLPRPNDPTTLVFNPEDAILLKQSAR